MKNIFNVYVEMESQEQCDRMKKLCVDNGLVITPRKVYDGFTFDKGFFKYFYYSIGVEVFQVWHGDTNNTQVTETEFIELLKQYKDE